MVLALAALTACRSELPTPTDPTIGGVYGLRTIDGSSLPITRQSDEGTYTIDAGILEFNEAQSFRQEIQFTLHTTTGNRFELSSAGGIWVQYGDDLQLNYVGESRSTIGRISGDRITVESSQGVFVFRK